jgi:hypothetical protein
MGSNKSFLLVKKQALLAGLPEKQEAGTGARKTHG